MPDDNRHDLELSRFWDELVESTGPSPDTRLDPAAAETLRRLHAMTELPPPAAARARVDRAMQQRAIVASNGKGDDPMTNLGDLASVPPANLSPHRASLRRPAHIGPWLAQFATAALLLVTIGLGYLVFGPGRGHVAPPAAFPESALAPASPTAEGTAQTLFSIMLPADQVPTIGPFDLVLWHIALAPGARAPVVPDAQTCCTGPQMTHVVAGEVSLTVDGPVRLYRGGSAGASDVPPATAITLRVGDTAVYDYARPTEFANLGAQEARFVSGGFWTGTLARPPFAESDDQGETPAGGAPVRFVDFTDVYPRTALPAGPVRVTLTNATLLPGGKTEAPPSGSLVVQVGAEGDASIGEAGNGSLRNIGAAPVAIYVMTVTPGASELVAIGGAVNHASAPTGT